MVNHFLQMTSCYLIAEIGVNHGGDLALAKEMVTAAKEAGADAVKFQTFTAEALVTPDTPKVAYQEKTTPSGESHYDMIRSLELARKDHEPLMEFCKTQEIDFISTPYDVDSARFLHELDVPKFKVASADVVDLPLHEFLATTGRPVILSTGMATLGEVEEMLSVYKDRQHNSLILLHCVSNYPCSPDSLNLKVMQTLAQAFQLPVGFSDHSEDNTAAVMAVALGARVIEKHFTRDRSLPGPDHQASSTPSEFADLVKAVRAAEIMLGSPAKHCQAEERQMAEVSRKSLGWKRDLSAGTVVSKGDITVLRPGTGLRPGFARQIEGKSLRQNVDAGTQINFDDILWTE